MAIRAVLWPLGLCVLYYRNPCTLYLPHEWKYEKKGGVSCLESTVSLVWVFLLENKIPPLRLKWVRERAVGAGWEGVIQKANWPTLYCVTKEGTLAKLSLYIAASNVITSSAVWKGCSNIRGNPGAKHRLESPHQRHLLRDRRCGTTACPACWGGQMKWNRISWEKKYFVLIRIRIMIFIWCRSGCGSRIECIYLCGYGSGCGSRPVNPGKTQAPNVKNHNQPWHLTKKQD